MAEIVPVVSEALEAKVRDLLPSQRGFGQDLQASNVITPIIDLTASAEGTSVPAYQQQAFAFGSITAFSANNGTAVVANSPGFYRILAIGRYTATTSVAGTISFTMTDGLTVKTLWTTNIRVSSSFNTVLTPLLDFTVFLASGESISATSSQNNLELAGSVRQTADVNGNPVNPSGFTPQ